MARKKLLVPLLLSLLIMIPQFSDAQTSIKIDPMAVPDIAPQNEDYAKARAHFHTMLLKKGPAPKNFPRSS